MSVGEAWFLSGIVLMFLLFLGFIGWGMLQTQHLNEKPIHRDPDLPTY